tara:strand:- start:201 stop:545 length:345 start_codon:yes stop_codon:yes gene_type:complete
MKININILFLVLIFLTILSKLLDIIGISSFYIDIAPNFFASLYLPIVIFILDQKKRFKKGLIGYSIISFLILISYEISQHFIPFFTFDIYDLISTLIGTIIIILISICFKFQIQ